MRDEPNKFGKDFYQQPIFELAQHLLGKRIVHRPRSGIITAVEIYYGEEDQACHARFGKTQRNAVMYGPPGYTYIYLCYGLHYLLNIVAEKEGFPAAILIRGMLPEERERAWSKQFSPRLELGPGSLTKFLKLTKVDSGRCLYQDRSLYLTPGIPIPSTWIQRGPRIGVDYAGEWAKKPWRWFVAPDFFNRLGGN